MTQVLEEFDHKFSRKERQLEIFKAQNVKLKDAFDQLKEEKNNIQMSLNESSLKQNNVEHSMDQAQNMIQQYEKII